MATTTRNEMIRVNEYHGGNVRTVQLTTNSYRLKFKNAANCYIHQYDLDIQKVDAGPRNDPNATQSKYICYEVFRNLNLPSKWAYDGKKNLYSPDGEEIERNEEMRIGRNTYTVTINGPVSCTRVQDIISSINTEAGIIPLDGVNALNIVLTHALAFNHHGTYTSVKRSFFKTDQRGYNMPGGLKLWEGIHTSVTPTEGFDITIKTLKTYQVMYPGGPLTEFIRENLKDPNANSRSALRPLPQKLNPGQIRTLSKILKNLKIQTMHLGYPRRYVVRGLSMESARIATLDNSPDTVENYFLGRFDITLGMPKLPCVKVGGTSLIPLELCELLPNQPYFTNLNAQQQREMIRQACLTPDEKMTKVQEATEEINRETRALTSRNYGFEIDTRAITLKGHVLNTPNMSGDVSKGQWRMNSVQSTGGLLNNAPHIQIISLCPDRSYNEGLHNSFTKLLIQRARALGIKMPQRIILRFSTLTNISSMLQAEGYNFVILDQDSSYGNVKLAESNIERTQCLKLQTVKKCCGVGRDGRPDINTLDNILKKFNMKTGGVNWSIDEQGLPTNVFNAPVMIVGADVTHFTRGENKPSVAAVVACVDQYAAKYISNVSVQYPEEGRQTVEYIRDMKNIMMNMLREYYKIRKAKPAKIIYYRDGVSEGQFENTVMEELGAIQDACTELQAAYKPKISVVVCTKRHKQRFVTRNSGGGGRGGARGGARGGGETYANLEPGTVIDSGVVSPNYMNFFLCSQQAIQGTSVPCHYYVLYDDSHLSAAMWQMLSYFLCHTYARCSRSVSYPAPIYYAHLACFSARTRMLSQYQDLDWTDTDNLPEEAEIEAIARPDNFHMFFI